MQGTSPGKNRHHVINTHKQKRHLTQTSGRKRLKLTTSLATEKTSVARTSNLSRATASDHNAIKAGIRNQRINKQKIKSLGNLSLNNSSQRRKKRKLQLSAVWNIMTVGTVRCKIHGREPRHFPGLCAVPALPRKAAVTPTSHSGGRKMSHAVNPGRQLQVKVKINKVENTKISRKGPSKNWLLLTAVRYVDS